VTLKVSVKFEVVYGSILFLQNSQKIHERFSEVFPGTSRHFCSTQHNYHKIYWYYLMDWAEGTAELGMLLMQTDLYRELNTHAPHS
jgi:hypothetical protein